LSDNPLNWTVFGEQVNTFDVVTVGGFYSNCGLGNVEPFNEMGFHVLTMNEAYVLLFFSSALDLDQDDGTDKAAGGAIIFFGQGCEFGSAVSSLSEAILP